jgi:hypothetical protein
MASAGMRADNVVFPPGERVGDQRARFSRLEKQFSWIGDARRERRSSQRGWRFGGSCHDRRSSSPRRRSSCLANGLHDELATGLLAPVVRYEGIGDGCDRPPFHTPDLTARTGPRPPTSGASLHAASSLFSIRSESTEIRAHFDGDQAGYSTRECQGPSDFGKKASAYDASQAKTATHKSITQPPYHFLECVQTAPFGWLEDAVMV